ncbi:hypothetical protein EV363DRAFT_1171410, partial [Boletus edulis]
HTFRAPDIEIDDAALDSWKHDELEDADALLTVEVTRSPHTVHHLLASRALARTRMQMWDEALLDATMVVLALLSRNLTLTPIYTKVINIQPTVIGFVAKSVAHVGKEERYKGYRTCDIAFEHFHSSHLSFLLLVKVNHIHLTRTANVRSF